MLVEHIPKNKSVKQNPDRAIGATVPRNVVGCGEPDPHLGEIQTHWGFSRHLEIGQHGQLLKLTPRCLVLASNLGSRFPSLSFVCVSRVR